MDGLIHKYDVYKHDTGEIVTDCFVLRPEIDPAAQAALLAYAETTVNDVLANDLIEWLKRIQRERTDL